MIQIQRFFFLVMVAVGLCLGLATVDATAQTYFYTGAAGGDFFDESNWNDAADGSGSSPVGDLIPDSSTGAIALDLVIDGDTVVAMGQVDFGTGSLTMNSSAMFDVTGADNDLDINPDSTFSLTDATLTVDGDAVFEGMVSFSGGSVTSLTDDVEFQDAITLSIDGTSFSSGDNTFFDGFAGSIVGASFTSADRLGVRNSVGVVMTDTSINVAGGTGDIDDVFAGAAGAGSSVTLLGSSSLLADTVEEGADLILGGSTMATMGGGGIRIVGDGSTITLNSTDALLIVSALDGTDVDFVDARPFLINGLTGVDYATDPSTWNVTNWNGTDLVTLQIVPEPSAVVLLIMAVVALLGFRRR